MRSRHLISATRAQGQGYICYSCWLKSTKPRIVAGLPQQVAENYSSSHRLQDEIRPVYSAGSPQPGPPPSVSTENLRSFKNGTTFSRSSRSIRQNSSLVIPTSNRNQIRAFSTKQANFHDLAEKEASGARFPGQKRQATLKEGVEHATQRTWKVRRVSEYEIHALQLKQSASDGICAHYGENGLMQPTFIKPLGDRTGTALSRTSSRLMRRPYLNTVLSARAGMVTLQSTLSQADHIQSKGFGTVHSLRNSEEAASRAPNPDSDAIKQEVVEGRTKEPQQVTPPSLTNSEETQAPNSQSPGKPESKASKTSLRAEKDIPRSEPKPKLKSKPKPKSKSKSKPKAKTLGAPKKNDAAFLAEHIETQIKELRDRLHKALGKTSPEPRASLIRRTSSRRSIVREIPMKSQDPFSESQNHASVEQIKRSKLVDPVTKALMREARFTKLQGTSLKEALSRNAAPIHSIGAADLNFCALDVDRPPVPRLAHGLERVLFNPGVYQLQDPRSGVYNFEPYLQKLMPIEEFDFNALSRYITSSKDVVLQEVAKEHGKRYIGSTSSMTGILAHFHFLLSQWRPINVSMLSKSFPNKNMNSFTEIQRCPSAIFLKWQDGTYAIDADKQFDSANVLSMLGKSMEKLLTLKMDDFERYRRSNPANVTEEELKTPESYHYSTMGDFLMRSQLDAYDPRVPGTGMFDLKTRAVVSVRMDVQRYEYGTGYQIKHRIGEWESFEREYFDMIRAAFLKYSLQVRMGRMDGVFVAFHNVERIFGFQYISLPEMDATIHGEFDTTIGDQEFFLSLDLLNKVLDKATKKFPKRSLRLHFETREAVTPFMYIFAEPMSDEDIHNIQAQNAANVEKFERQVLGLTTSGDASQTGNADTSKWEDIQANVEDAMDRDELSLSEGAEENDDLPEAQNNGENSHDGAFDEENLNRASAGNDEEMEEGEHEEDEEEGAEETEEAEIEEGEEEEQGEGEEEEEEGEEETSNEEGELPEDEGIEKQVVESGGEGVEDGEGSSRREDRKESEVERAMNAVTGSAVAQGEGSQFELSPEGDSSSSGMEGSAPMEPDLAANRDTESVPLYTVPDSKEDDYSVEADPTFFETLSTDENLQPDPQDELLAMTLTVRNKVNSYGILRPERLKPEDKWSIEYSLAEVPSVVRAHALYEACKVRRRKRLEQEVQSSFKDREEAGPLSEYVKLLRKMSIEGRAWRQEMDEKAKEQPVHVLGRDK